MSDDHKTRDLERRLARSLHAAAPSPAPDLADRLLSRTAAESQRRTWGGLAFVPALGAAAVVVVAIIVGIGVGSLLPRPGGPGVEPSVSPSPTEAATPEPTSSEEPAPSPSPEAFPDGSRCTNETLGVIISYPADWFANEAVEPDDEVRDRVEACQYFSDQPMEIAPNAGLPPTVAIIFSLVPEELPSSGTTISSEEVTVAGRQATVTESEGTGDGPFFSEGDFSYGYQITMPDGQILLAGTYFANDGDYEAHKEVLDQMMQALELIEG